ncbi:hypothetical protein HK405_001091, partial [Cladochytrium tenue]
ATAVEIHFKTEASAGGTSASGPGAAAAPAAPPVLPSFRDTFLFRRPVAAMPSARSIVYRNNGRPFAGEDWGRLRKIAEGNPDEQKIGFFGVGFYSLFSICEEPFVTSGDECMAFFWKGDQLFTRKGPVAPESASEWTTFFLSLREPMEVPAITQFGRFLATSLTFTRNLKKIEASPKLHALNTLTHPHQVFIDDDRVLLLNKKAGEVKMMDFQKGNYNMDSANSIFRLTSVSMMKVQLDVTAKLDYDKERGRGQDTEMTTFMRTCTGLCDVRLNGQMAREMERTTKKKAPATTEIHIQFANYDELESSTVSKGRHPILEDL